MRRDSFIIVGLLAAASVFILDPNGDGRVVDGCLEGGF